MNPLAKAFLATMKATSLGLQDHLVFLHNKLCKGANLEDRLGKKWL